MKKSFVLGSFGVARKVSLLCALTALLSAATFADPVG